MAEFKGKRKARTFKGKGKLSGRTCVRVDLAASDPKAKSKVKGVTLKRTQFRGCFTSASEANAVAKRMATIATLPKGKKRAKKSRKKSRR